MGVTIEQRADGRKVLVFEDGTKFQQTPEGDRLGFFVNNNFDESIASVPNTITAAQLVRFFISIGKIASGDDEGVSDIQLPI